MLSMYSLKIDIISHDPSIGEAEFRELTAPCLSYLDALKGAFDKRPASVTFYPPSHSDNAIGWSLRYVLSISVGKDRGQNLMNLYPAIVRLIEFDLPDFEVQAETAVLKFS